MKEQKLYVCDYCGTQYKEKSDCLKCEKLHEAPKEMTYKDALEVLRYSLRNQGNKRHCADFDGMLKVAFTAIKKQIPMKPDIEQDEYDFDYLACPSCRSFLVSEFDLVEEDYRINYCDFCGQSIDLDEYDAE